MTDPLRAFLGGKVLLLAVPADVEAGAVLAAFGSGATPKAWHAIPIVPGVELIVTGVGKANAAGAVARALDPARHGAVLSVGVAGTYGIAALGSVVAATECVYADEGVRTPEGFVDMSELGFPPAGLPGMRFPVDQRLLDVLRPFADVAGPIATVSTCSGLDGLAREIAARTGAVAEVMEGAAVAHVAYRLGVPAGELRVISNSTGDRALQKWDMKGALAKLSAVIGRLCG